VLGEAPAPSRHRRAADAERRRHAQTGRTRLGAGQHGPDAPRQGLAHAAPAQQAPQFRPLGLRQFQRYRLRPTRHGAPPLIGRTTVTPTAINRKRILNSAH
jgi:hypothetical protein